MNLRPYQVTGKLLLSECFQRGLNAVCACAPTGSGKTVTFADIARDTVLNGGRVMVLCHRTELISQAKDKLNKSALFPTIIDPTWTGKLSNLYVASVQTLVNRKLPELDLLIVDECHFRNFDETIIKYIEKGTKVIGFSATPFREGKAKLKDYPNYTGQLCDIYQELVTFTTISELLESNFLVEAIHTGPEIDMSDVKIVNTKDGLEFSAKESFKKYNKPEMYGGVIENYNKFSKGKRAICFNIDVEHSMNMHDEFIKSGIPSVHIDGKTKKQDRKRALQDFEDGKILVLNNCEIATTGIDIPAVHAVIINRPVFSLSLYLQICGRGSRPFKDKTHFMVIDHGSNYWRHGYWKDERDFNLDPKLFKKKGVTPVVNCEECDALIPANIYCCPYCQVMQDSKKVDAAKEAEALKLAEAEFVILNDRENNPLLRKPIAQMTIKELEEYRELKGYKMGWIVRQLFTRGAEALEEYRSHKNYTTAWVKRQIEMADNEKETAKNNVWNFVTSNPHLTDDEIVLFSSKKLKGVFTQPDIDEMLPNILIATKRFKAGEIDIEGNEILIEK